MTCARCNKEIDGCNFHISLMNDFVCFDCVPPLEPTAFRFERGYEVEKIEMGKIGEYNQYFRLSSAIEARKKKWVPLWLWRLVADVRFIGDPEWD